MTQTIDTTRGEADYFTAIVTENRGHSLADAVWHVALGGDVDADDAQPSGDDWRPADLVEAISASQPSSVRVGLFATSADKGTDRRLWVRLTLGDVVRILVAGGTSNRLDVL